MNLNVLPVEIWYLIFSLACTDDGSTGRSLSLVSARSQRLSSTSLSQSLASLGLDHEFGRICGRNMASYFLACQHRWRTGRRGRSLSLISTHFREISAPFKCQCIALSLTGRKSPPFPSFYFYFYFYCRFPASHDQKKTLSLFVHHTGNYPFLGVNGCPSSTTVTDQASE